MVTPDPTNKPCIRVGWPTRVFATMEAKRDAMSKALKKSSRPAERSLSVLRRSRRPKHLESCSLTKASSLKSSTLTSMNKKRRSSPEPVESVK